MKQETSIGGSRSRFHTTLWDTVRQAKDGVPGAIDQLVIEYWKPIYFFIRRKGHDVEASKDLTQGFLGAFLEKNRLAQVSPELGKFRSLIMASVTNYLADERDRAGALKRGGGLDFVQAEEDLAGTDPSPEQAFFRGWVLSVVERAVARLKEEVPAVDFELLSGVQPPGMGVSERKNRLHRLRVRLRGYVRDIAAGGVDDEKELESELRTLFASLA